MTRRRPTYRRTTTSSSRTEALDPMTRRRPIRPTPRRTRSAAARTRRARPPAATATRAARASDAAPGA
eukprot:6943-Pelagococcus_subviridis.AAC.1